LLDGRFEHFRFVKRPESKVVELTCQVEVLLGKFLPLTNVVVEGLLVGLELFAPLPIMSQLFLLRGVSARDLLLKSVSAREKNRVH